MTSTLPERTFLLEPADSERLSNLAGPFDGHLRQIELRLGVEIANRGNIFRVTGRDEAMLDRTEKLLKAIGWSVADVDLWEVNEAFAVVPMALMKELNVPHDKVNVNGGACALGHPIGASGARIMVTLIHALKARGLKKGLATLCIGGGEGTAVALELG